MSVSVDKRKDVIVAEIKKQLCLAGPLVAVNVLVSVIQIISVMFVGHLGELALSGASMATSMAGVTGFSLMVGLSGALDTLCGQAFGAKKHHMLGVHAQRAMLVISLVSIPVAIIWAYVGKILLLLKQDPEISLEAGTYTQWLIPSILAYGLLQCEIKFLQSQNIVFPMLLSSAFSTLLHLPLCWVLVFKSGLGSRGAALSSNISYWVNTGLLAFYIKFSPTCKSTWLGFSNEAFKDIKNFLKLGVPSAFMVCLEYWSFEMMVILSGILPNPKLETSVLAISLNSMTMIYMIVFALSSVVSIRVSNELGSGKPRAAKLAIQVMMSIITVEGAVVSLGLLSLRNVWGKLYSNEPDVLKYIASMMPLISASTFLDAYQCGLSGIARGCGKQKIGAFVNLGAYYIVGLPLGTVFAFVLHLKGKGLWLGIICAISVQLLLLLIVTLFTKWDKEAKKASEAGVHSSSNEDDHLEMTVI